MKQDYIQSLKKGLSGTIHAVFESVLAAGWAFAKLTTFRDFRGCQVAYGPDPCSRPLEMLSEDEPPAERGPKISTNTEHNASDHDVDAGSEAGDYTAAQAPPARTVRHYITTVNSSGHVGHKLMAETPAKSSALDTSNHVRQASPKAPPALSLEAEEDLLINLTQPDQIISSASSTVSSDDTPSPNGTLRTRSRSRASSTTTVTVIPTVNVMSQCREPVNELTISQIMTSTH